MKIIQQSRPLIFYAGLDRTELLTKPKVRSRFLLSTSGISFVWMQSIGLPTYCEAEMMMEKANMQVVVSLGEYFVIFRKNSDISKLFNIENILFYTVN